MFGFCVVNSMICSSVFIWGFGPLPLTLPLALYEDCSGESYILIMVNLQSSCGKIVTAWKSGQPVFKLFTFPESER